MDTLRQKISHLNALYHLASADNDISEVELVYIRKVAEHLGVTLSHEKLEATAFVATKAHSIQLRKK